MIEHVYLDAPFRHEIRDIEDSRFACVTHAAGKLWQDGSMAFSPITHEFHKRTHGYLNEVSYATHLRFNKKILRQCEKLIVLKLPELAKSKGVAIEISGTRVANAGMGDRRGREHPWRAPLYPVCAHSSPSGCGLNRARENSIPILRVEPEELVPDFVLNKLHYLYEKHKPHKKGQH